MNSTDNYKILFDFYKRSKKYCFEDHPEWLFDHVTPRKNLFEHSKLNHHKKIFDHFINTREEIINVFVVGEGNFGKSTLINAILGGNVAKMDFLPTTWFIHRYLYGESRAVIYFSNNKSEDYTFNNAKVYLANEEQKARNNKAYESPVLSVDWYYNEFSTLRSFTIVDTPGIAQLRTILSDRSIEEFYYKADCVLWLLDANRVNSDTTNKSLEQISRFSKKIIGVVNKWDRIPEAKRTNVLEQAKISFGHFFAEIIPVSAKLGLESLNHNENLTNSGIPHLTQQIANTFLVNNILHKNIQFYHTFRLTLNESYKIMNVEANTLITNKELYISNYDLIIRSKQSTLNGCIDAARMSFLGYYSSIYSNIRQNVNFKNAINYVSILIDQTRITSNIDFSFSEAKKHRDHEFYSLIEKLSIQKYIEVLYQYDGSVLAKEELSNISNLPELVRFESFQINISLNIKTWDKFKETALDFFGNVFKIARDMADENRRQLHNDIINQISNKVDYNWSKMQLAISDNINIAFNNLLTSFDNQFSLHFKNTHILDSRIQDANNRKELCNVKQHLFITQVLNSLRNN